MRILKYAAAVILFLFSAVSCFAQEQEAPEIITYTSGDWDYIENDSGITLTVYRGSEADLVIPSELDGKPVTRLEKNLFSSHTELVSAVIPDSVTSVGSNLFYACTSLETVHLSNKLKTIPENAFRYCSSLKTVDVSVLVTEIGNYAFADCLSLEEIKLPSVTKVGNFAFSNCASLREISLLSASSIGQSAFVNCIQLKELILYSVTSISDNAFDYCIQLDSVTLSQKLSSVGSNVFRDTAWINNQTDEFVIIGQGILIRYNGSETDVQIPYNVKKIVDAFMDNYSVESVVIPDSVVQIDANAFRDAVSLRTIQFPAYLTSIGSNAFNGCRSLTEVNLPPTVKRISSSAFENCSVLQRFEVPELVTEISAKLLSECTELKDVVIPASVGNISGDAFSGSPNVTLQVAYASSAETFAQEKEIPYSYITRSDSDFVYSRDEEGIHIVRYIGFRYDVEIPAQIDGVPVVSIEAGAFQNNRRVTRVVVPLTVKTVGDRAFSYMDHLQTVQFSIGQEELGANLFAGDSSLREVRFLKGIRAIGEAPFDEDVSTVICAAEDTAAAELLSGMGYDVRTESECTEDAETLALWAELYELEDKTPEPVPCLCDTPVVTVDTSYEILRIPDGVSVLNAEMLENAAGHLALIIPASVTEIDEGILETHEIETIISTVGSAAEVFAREKGIQFLVEFTFRMG